MMIKVPNLSSLFTKFILIFLLFSAFSVKPLSAQPEHDVITAYCYYGQPFYRVVHPDDWFFYECNPQYIVKWKHYSVVNGECELNSVTYGADSPFCLECGVIRLEIMSG